MELHLTEKAIDKVKNFSQSNPDAQGKLFRVYVQGGGCSGFQYGFAFDEKREDDHIIQAGNLTVLLDPMSAPFIENATIDYEENFKGAGFVVKNPQAKGTCGCGSSFSI